MAETKIIPIFPLDLVLFPRQELPLRIFEPRYKQLVDDCMLGDGQFGVCLIDEHNSVKGWNSPNLVGTIAKINKCEDVELDGLQLHIETMGRSSFRIKKLFHLLFLNLQTMIHFQLRDMKKFLRYMNKLELTKKCTYKLKLK